MRSKFLVHLSISWILVIKDISISVFHTHASYEKIDLYNFRFKNSNFSQPVGTTGVESTNFFRFDLPKLVPTSVNNTRLISRKILEYTDSDYVCRI